MKFSIRDLLLVTMTVALALGWWMDRSRLANEIHILSSLSRLRVPKFPLSKNEQQQIQAFFKSGVLPNSSAPAPKAPKD